MKIYPAIDIRHGTVVQLVGGDPNNVAVSAGTPAAAAEKWKKEGARRYHVVDLDAALGGHNQWTHLAAILRQGLPVQFGGGVRHMTEVQQILDLGAHRIVVGTQGIENPAWLRELCTVFPDRIVLAVDARGRDVVTHGWTESTGKDVVDLARSMADAGLAGFLYTNVAKEGRMGGIDMDVVLDLRAAVHGDLVVSGGISSDADLDALADAGVDGVVLGMSIYTEAINLKEAVRRHEDLEVVG